MKRAFMLFLTIGLLIGCISFTAIEAKATTVDSGTCGANLTWILDDQGTLTISGTGNMTNYASKGAPWFSTQNRSRIKKVIIEEGVTSIGSYAFANLPSITEITTPSSVTKIGEHAFLYCESLQSFVVPNGVRTIAEFTFSNCTSLTTVVIPDSVRSFDDMAFNNCSSLEYINIPDGVTELPYSMLAGCNSLEYISIPSTLTRIHPQVFDDCGNLWDVYFAGTSSQYQSIRIDSYGNEALSNATIHYSSKAPCRTHAFGNCTNVSDTQHSRICANCGYVETVSHTWNSGTVTKTATCKEDGVKTYTCTGCNATKTETIAKTTDHKYGSWTKVNDTTHKHTCSVCSKEETASHTWNSGTVTKTATCKEDGVKTYTCTGCNATKTETIAKLTTHTYDHACDTDCNVCGATRTTTHNYTATWSKDSTSHWHECTVCKDKKDVAAHTPGAEPTETTAQICTECGYVIKAALGHTHNYAEGWTSDENGHWHICSGCEDKGSYAAHIPGPNATATTDQVCTECGYVLKDATGETEPTTPPTQAPNQQPTLAPTEPATQPDSPEYDFPLGAVIIAVVAIAGIVVCVILLKKKH